MRLMQKPGTRTLGSLRTRPDADVELQWYFNRSLCDLGVRSDFHEQLGVRAPHEGPPGPDEMVDAAHALRKIEGWLRELSHRDWGILHAAYEVRAWPMRLHDHMGRLTGVVVRLACGYAGEPVPDDDARKDVVLLTTAEALALDCGRSGSPLVRLRREAERHFTLARHAYVKVRGKVLCVVRWA